MIFIIFNSWPVFLAGIFQMKFKNKSSYQEQIYSYMDTIYVICPGCRKQAIVKALNFSFYQQMEEDVRLICASCGHTKILKEVPSVIVYRSKNKLVLGKHIYVGGTIDPFFHLPLWLSEICCGNFLWAYNYDHLDYLQTHLESKIKKQVTEKATVKVQPGRLPRWMTESKNREAVLQMILHMKNR